MDLKIKNRVLLWIMVISASIRIVLANWLGIWFPCSQLYDDAILVRYANLAEHFSNPGPDSLLKYMGYPVFLKVVSLSHLPYPTVTALLWIITALGVYFMAKRLTGRQVFAVVAYLYILFMPIAFELHVGTRLYRNAVIAPFSLISLVGMGMLILCMKDDGRGILKCIGISLFTGIAFTWCYYLKEDGIWIKVCLLFCLCYMAIVFVCRVIRGKQRKVKAFLTALILLAIPLLVYKEITRFYRNVNYEAFEVSDLNTRTEGELGEFVNLIYSIESPDRTAAIWAPSDAIQKAFDASPTLQEHDSLLQSIRVSSYCDGDIEKNPIRGDFLTWVMRDVLRGTGLWESEKQISDLFEQVNDELRAAFKNGSLKKDTSRIQLLKSAGGRTEEEILELFPNVLESFVCTVFCKGYSMGALLISDEEIAIDPNLCVFASYITNTDYLYDYSIRLDSVLHASKVCEIFLLVYKFINPVLFIGAWLIIIGQLLVFLLNWKKRKQYLETKGYRLEMVFMTLVLFGVGFVYSFGISWFSSFLGKQEQWVLNFYNIALPGILALAYLLAFSSIFANRGKQRRKKENIDG